MFDEKELARERERESERERERKNGGYFSTPACFLANTLRKGKAEAKEVEGVINHGFNYISKWIFFGS